MRKVSLTVKKPFELKKRLAVIYRGNFRAFMITGANEIINDNISNILHQRTPSGGILKKNSPATLRIKSRLGKGRLSLIWNRVLINTKTWISKTTKKRARILLAASRSKTGRIVRNMGYEFFGISIKARARILRKWREFIKRGLR